MLSALSKWFPAQGASTPGGPGCLILAEKPTQPLLRRNRNGFSLVEVALAIGVVSFAFISILGLIPAGLNTFRDSVDVSVSRQIFERLINEAQQTDFDELASHALPLRPPLRYFDDQANELPATRASKAIYHVNTRIITAAALPCTNTATKANANIAMITVQIANNPANIDLDSQLLENGEADDQTKPLRSLWKSNGVFGISTRSTIVARNK